MHLKDLLSIQDLQLRNRKLKAAFQPASDGIEVLGSEAHAIVVLLNLTSPGEINDYCHVSSAIEVMNNEKHIDHCINEIQWFHSHNLKYPDARVSKQRLICPPPPLSQYYVTSANYEPRVGWSHNSKEIRKARLFSAEFKFRGRWVCLASLLASREKKWIRLLHWMGVRGKELHRLLESVEELFSLEAFPSVVSRYSPQVIFPRDKEYISITPVVSHAVQSAVQKLRRNSENGRKFTTVSHEHSANIGNLCAASGGKVSYLYYPPTSNFQRIHSLGDTRKQQLLKSETVFLSSAINNKRMLQALRTLVLDDSITIKKRRQKRVSALRFVRRQLAKWIAPLIEWRDTLESEDELTGLSEDCLEYKLLTVNPDEFVSTLNDLNIRLHKELQDDTFGGRYAYHPELIAPIRSQLRWLLVMLAQPEEREALPETDTIYMHLSNMRVYDANALSNAYLCGTPSLSAVWGMSHAFQRRLNRLLPFEVHISSFAWFIHQYYLVKGRKLPEYNELKKGELKRPGFIAGRKCDLTIDLVLTIKCPRENSLTNDDIELVQAALPGSFAGGVIHPPSLFEQKNWCELHNHTSILFNRLASMPASGNWITPSDKRIDSLNELVDVIEQDSSILPVMQGYAFLESPASRTGSLTDKHCYAEPILGLSQRESAIDIRLKGKKNFFAKAFWELESSDCSMLIKCANN